MNRAERELQNRLYNGVDGLDYADAQPVDVQGGQKIAHNIEGNPRFDATFNLKFIANYFTLNGGAYTKIAPSALNAGLQTDLPYFVFANNDYFGGGFKNLKASFDIGSNWVYGRPGIFGVDDFSELGFDATVEAVLRPGDMVIPFTSALPGAGTTSLALYVIRCQEVAYGSLLSMIDSARFKVVGFRYVISDQTKLAQFENKLEFKYLSIFGAGKNDSLTPSDYITPGQFQDQRADVPVKGIWGAIDKFIGWGFFNTYDLETQNWTMFVQQIRKLSA